MSLSRLILLCSALAVSVPAVAADVAVVVNAHGGPVDPAGVEAVVWHAMLARHALTPLVVEAPDALAALSMGIAGVTTLLAVDVTWHPGVVHLGDGLVATPPTPDVAVVEYVLHRDRLVERSRWTAEGSAVVYRTEGVSRSGGPELLTMPEVSLQDAVWSALAPVNVPAWGVVDAPLRVPILVAADEEYRATYGDAWLQTARRRIDAASHLLAQAGIALDVVGDEAWSSPDRAGSDLGSLLVALDATPCTVERAVLRVAFTGQPRLDPMQRHQEDVGRAFTPGRDVVVVDQALPPGHDPVWDVAEESIAVAHEVLHALGVPHEETAGFLMSAHKESLVWRLSERSRALARAAAQARVAHWDPVAALLALVDAAELWLPESPRLQLAYVVLNLPAVPEPGALPPDRASPLANAVLARQYARLAQRGGVGDVHRTVALAHTAAVIEMAPALAEDLADLLPEPLATTAPSP